MQSLLEYLPNYIHYDTTMKPYQEVHGITFITYGTTMRSHQEVHGITSITSCHNRNRDGTTKQKI